MEVYARFIGFLWHARAPCAQAVNMYTHIFLTVYSKGLWQWQFPALHPKFLKQRWLSVQAPFNPL